MTSSNAYVATDSETVMKVGKANDVKRREKQIAIRITRTIACLDEAAALRMESKLRDFVMKRGGVRYRNTIDWFQFDSQIYQMLCEFAAGLNHEPITPLIEADVDTEIAEYIMRYHQLLVEEVIKERDDVLQQKMQLKAEIENVQDKNQRLQKEIEQLRQEKEILYERIEGLIRKEAYWETRYKLQAKISEAEKNGELSWDQRRQIIMDCSLDESAEI